MRRRRSRTIPYILFVVCLWPLAVSARGHSGRTESPKSPKAGVDRLFDNPGATLEYDPKAGSTRTLPAPQGRTANTPNKLPPTPNRPTLSRAVAPLAAHRLGGIHAFLGTAVALGRTTGHYISYPVHAQIEDGTAAVLSLSAGLFVGPFSFSLEISPMTDVPKVELGSMFTVALDMGLYVPFLGKYYWPFHGAVGAVVAGFDKYSPYDSSAIHMRFDLIGFAYRSGPLLFEVNLPSLRINGWPIEDDNSLYTRYQAFTVTLAVLAQLKMSIIL